MAERPSVIDNHCRRANLPEGWWPLYDQLVADLARFDPALEVEEAKEKFGELRIYLATSIPEANALVDAASCQSRKTCQRCSAPGQLMSTAGGLYATVCPEHARIEGFEPVSRDPIVASFRVIHEGRIERRNR